MSDQARGNFIAGVNRKEPGSKKPDFTGRLSIPGRDHEFAIAVWANKDKNDKRYFAGRMDGMPITEDVLAQIDALQTGDAPVVDAVEAGPNLTLKPREFVLFANGFRDADHPDRPHYWGRLNPGDGTPVVAISMWLKQDRYGRPLLAGATTFPQPGKSAEALEPAADLEQLIEQGAVTRGVGRKGKARGGEGRA